MTLCHQLFCRKIFQHGENGRGRQHFGHFTVSTRNLLPTSCLSCKQAGHSSSNVVSCFISVMSVRSVIRAGAGNLSLPRTHQVVTSISILMFGSEIFGSRVNIREPVMWSGGSDPLIIMSLCQPIRGQNGVRLTNQRLV